MSLYFLTYVHKADTDFGKSEHHIMAEPGCGRRNINTAPQMNLPS